MIYQWTEKDVLWVGLSAILCFFMQSGFLLIESGLTRSKNSINITVKTLTIIAISFICFWVIGFAFIFGVSINGWIGSDYFFFSTWIDYVLGEDGEKIFYSKKVKSLAEGGSLTIFFIFQSILCSITALIASGAITERVHYRIYIFITLIISCILYPIFGHWAWGDSLGRGINGWLNELGFVDFAGATVVHSMGGWCALALMIIVGARIDRFTKDGRSKEIIGGNLPLAGVGLLILWFGWFGFNGGASFELNNHVPSILLRTMISGAFGMISALALGWLVYKIPNPKFLIMGSISGLVAISAGAHCIDETKSIWVGCIAGILSIIFKSIIEKMKLDDAIEIIPTYLVAGIWGTLSIAFFGNTDFTEKGLNFIEQLKAQSIGILVCGVWSFGNSFILFKFLNMILPFRISEKDEREGLNLSAHKVSTELHDFYRVLNQDTSEESQDETSITEFGQLAKGYKNRLEKDLNERTRALNDFLSLTNQGFFSFGREVRIEKGYSKECERIFGIQDLEDKEVTKILFSPKETMKQKNFSDSIRLIFSGELRPEVIFRLLENNVHINNKEIDLEYKRIDDERIMCIMTDVTKTRELEKKLSSDKDVQNHLFKIISNARYFANFMEEVKNLFSFLEILDSFKDVENIKSYILQVHNIKAGFGFFGFEKTMYETHSLEDFLISIDKNTSIEKFKEKFMRVKSVFDKEIEFLTSKLGDEWLSSFDPTSIFISFDRIVEIENKIKEKYKEDPELLEHISSLKKIKAEAIFRHFPQAAKRLADKRGKKVAVHIKGGDILLEPIQYKTLSNSLLHIIRNMIDHGVETPEERASLGKSEESNIILEIRDKNKKYITIILTGDGRGIDWDKIRAIGEEKQILTKGQKVSRSRLNELIFEPNISTSSKVDEISGRGVGMSVVKKEIDTLKGGIRIITKSGEGTSFIIRIPKKKV